MPRTPRVELEGAIHHVTMRGNRRQLVFVDDHDYAFFLRLFYTTAERFNWTCLAYCLMPNHFHLVIETPEKTLGLGMHRLAGTYAQAFNSRHGTDGHLFQDRYANKLVDSDAYVVQLLPYLARNPVKAGLCADPCEWPWSSHGRMLRGAPETARGRARVEELLAAWGGVIGTGYARLFGMVDGPAVPADGDSPWEVRPPLDALLASRPGDAGMRAAREYGYQYAEIAAAIGVDPSTVSRRLRRAAARDS